MRYLFDYAQSFYIIYGPFVNVLAGGIMAAGAILLIVWGILPHLTRRA